MVQSDILFDIGIIIIVATMFAYFARMLKQPLIPAYILAGVVLGPIFGVITNQNVITTLSEIGIAFLLFIVGMEIDLRKLKHVGLVATLGGVIQIVFIFAIAFIISLLLGFIALEAIYIAVLIALSSTMVVIKLLSDKKELDTLHGKIIIGILLLQDLVAIIVLSVFVSLNEPSAMSIYISLLKGILIIASAIIIAKYTFPLIFNFAAKSQELLFISAVAISMLYSIIFNLLDFSIAIGAFIAGISLANLPYNIQIISKVKSLRDFFSVLFFASLGMKLLLTSISGLIVPLIILLLLVIVIKPIIMMFTTSFFGYRKRVSFLTAISLAQISEFSLIIVTQGLLLGHISQEIFSIAVLLSVVTITLTSYFIKYEKSIYQRLSNRLSIFDRLNDNKQKLEYHSKSKSYEVILCGYNRIGYGVTNTLAKLKKSYIVIDFDPSTIKSLIRQKVPCMYGDIGDIEILERLNFKKAQMVISTVPTKDDNMLLTRIIRKKSKRTTIVLTASQIEEALDLYDIGADYVVMPHFLGGEHVSLLIKDFSSDVGKILSHKIKHLTELKERRNPSEA